ncbi:hypothetical protein E2C01_055306 [Portunus trituberculatus]|uniref:Uncharacterized protein n=1 Tax=Portunus trituberculatus TaxID=210409 RepID=A0A5B7GUH2_PORTR|nr:hypothetical protein [Portunus trituberculatus]
MNNTKSVKEFKQGTLLWSFEHIGSETVNNIASETGNNIQPQKVQYTLEVQNDFLPASDQGKAQEIHSRPEKLTELIKWQKGSYLTRVQKEELKATILENHDIFILDKN